MLNIHSDRLDYRELLSPPQDYSVEFAFATTYSVDLNMIIALCAIIGLDVEADAEILQHELYMLEAIRKASDKLLVFCQSGQIKVPSKPNKLLSLIENCVCEVSLEENKSFHAKTWFIKYSCKSAKDYFKYRLVVLSRNLTFDHSWDVAIYLDSACDGQAEIKTEVRMSESLKNFLEWMGNAEVFHNDKLERKRSLLKNLASEFSSVKWAAIGEQYDSIDFIYFGLPNVVPHHNLYYEFQKMIIVSPFLTGTVINKFLQAKSQSPDSEFKLITRDTELWKLTKIKKVALQNASFYILKDEIINSNTTPIDDLEYDKNIEGVNMGNDDTNIQNANELKTHDIHAKIYLRSNNSHSDLYLGSANATYNALEGGNVECLIRLQGKEKFLNVKTLIDDLELEGNGPFKIAPSNVAQEQKEDEIHQELIRQLKNFCATKKIATVSGSGPFNLSVNIIDTDKLTQRNYKIYLIPLMLEGRKPQIQPIEIHEKIDFTIESVSDLSEWYKIFIKCDSYPIVSCVTKIQTVGIPNNRDETIFGSYIHNRETFFMYINILLSDDYTSTYTESKKFMRRGSRGTHNSIGIHSLYERMLKAASISNLNLHDIRGVLRAIDINKIEGLKDFEKLYDHFERVCYGNR